MFRMNEYETNEYFLIEGIQINALNKRNKNIYLFTLVGKNEGK